MPVSWCQPHPERLPLTPTRPTPGTSGSFITLAMTSFIAPVTVILAGSSLHVGASHGGNCFLDSEPGVCKRRLGTQKAGGYQERVRQRGKSALTSFPLSVSWPWETATCFLLRHILQRRQPTCCWIGRSVERQTAVLCFLFYSFSVTMNQKSGNSFTSHLPSEPPRTIRECKSARVSRRGQTHSTRPPFLILLNP